MICIAFISNYTMKILVAAKYKYRENGGKCETFMDIGKRSAGRLGRFAVQFAQVGSQLGTCSIYIVYIAQVSEYENGGFMIIDIDLTILLPRICTRYMMVLMCGYIS